MTFKINIKLLPKENKPMTLKVIAAIFAAYECYKMLNTQSFKALIERTKAAGRPEEASQAMQVIKNPFFMRVMLIELAYMVFALILIFTAYWYFTIVLFTISFSVIMMDTNGRKGNLILGMGSAISAALLMTIVMS